MRKRELLRQQRERAAETWRDWVARTMAAHGETFADVERVADPDGLLYCPLRRYERRPVEGLQIWTRGRVYALADDGGGLWLASLSRHPTGGDPEWIECGDG